MKGLFLSRVFCNFGLINPPSPTPVRCTSQAKKKSVILSLYMIKIISNRKTTKMRYCEYSYGVNCVFSFQLCFVMHPLLQIMSTKNNTNGISETTGKVCRAGLPATHLRSRIPLIPCPGPDTVSRGFNFDPLHAANPGDSESP
jgi:hypothetical protein